MNSTLGQLVRQAWSAVEPDPIYGWIAQLAEHDRFQASHGILRAAELVRDAALQLGLQDVRIHQFPADGCTSFWTFRSPRSWTPTIAILEIPLPSGEVMVLDHASQPFLIATYSSPTHLDGVSAQLVLPSMDVEDCIALLDARSFGDRSLLKSLEGRGALGFVTEACCRRDAQGQQVSGRIELDPWTRLFGFSVTAQQFEKIGTAVGSRVHARIRVDRTAKMSAVSALLPAQCPPTTSPTREVWLTAHLCHPRPGANDNASGVAALLGTAAALKVLAACEPHWALRHRAVRLIWAPEFVGTAAVLNAAMASGGAATFPSAVLNLDMVGEDQTLCGSPFIVERTPEIERSPGTLAALLAPLAERTVSEVFQHSAEYGGTWRSSSFLGYSDHALFAGPNVSCPAVQLAHWPDRFNHCGADTLDKVSTVELRRAVTAATVITQCLASDYQLVKMDMPEILRRWCAAENEKVARHATEQSAQTSSDWNNRLRSHVCAYTATVLSAGDILTSHLESEKSESVNFPLTWRGPLNLRAIVAALAPERKDELTQLIFDNKLVLAALSNLAVRASVASPVDDLFEEVEFALRRPLDRNLLGTLYAALLESGWISSPKNSTASGSTQQV